MVQAIPFFIPADFLLSAAPVEKSLDTGFSTGFPQGSGNDVENLPESCFKGLMRWFSTEKY